MIQIGTTLVTEDLIEKDFVCNLNACKGACCVAGEYGAPLESWEADKLEEILPNKKALQLLKNKVPMLPEKTAS